MTLLLKFIDRFKLRLESELSAKTGWGRNEIKAAIQRAIDGAMGDVVN